MANEDEFDQDNDCDGERMLYPPEMHDSQDASDELSAFNSWDD